MAVLTNVCPAWSGRERAVTRICATSSRAIRPSTQFGGAQVPWLGTSETSSSPAGTRSRKTTRRAVLGPALRTVTVNWMSDPAGIDGAAATFVTTRSTSERIAHDRAVDVVAQVHVALLAAHGRDVAQRPPARVEAGDRDDLDRLHLTAAQHADRAGRAFAAALAGAQGHELEPGGQHVAHADPGRAARAEVRDAQAEADALAGEEALARPRACR